MSDKIKQFKDIELEVKSKSVNELCLFNNNDKGNKENDSNKLSLKKTKSKDDLQVEFNFKKTEPIVHKKEVKLETRLTTSSSIACVNTIPITNYAKNELPLPPEILENIFIYLISTPYHLAKSSLVCKYWYSLATPLLYRKPKFKDLNSLHLLSTSLKSTSNFKLVSILDLTQLDEMHRNNPILSQHLANLIPLLGSELKHLDLGFCKGLKNYDLQRVLPYLLKLQYLNLAGGNRSDIVLTKLVKHCKLLKKLSLSWNSQLTDFGFIELAKNCQQLIYLDLTNCAQISDYSVVAIANHCNQLEVLSLSYCQCITDTSLFYILANCNKLKVLNVLGCSGVSSKFATKAKLLYPELHLNLPGLLPFYFKSIQQFTI
ncbi:RNI-like protein [Neoconidiobolus thromboides FSU 785]|nr:RNI-like protein [Neoconidiobolus thromboides FSU 785]